VRVSVNGHLAGNAFACRWSVNGRVVCWITQLVVHHEYRERGLAAGLLNEIRLNGDDVYGIMSSHPAACLAAAKAFGSKLIEPLVASSDLISNPTGSINTVSLDFTRDNAARIMIASPVGYVRDSQLRGKLFDPTDTSGLVCGVDTGFFVDHEEPLDALAWVQENMHWPLGDLLDGHEYILILQAKRRSRSRSRSAGLGGTS
jgi:hypothetical protein